MTTIPEEAGKVATSAIEGLKTNPACLAAIIMAAIFAAMFFFIGQQNERRSHERMVEVVKLLQVCFPAGGEPTYPPRARVGIEEE
jgi:hypothetical protein